MGTTTENIILDLVSEYTTHEALVDLDAHVFKDLNIYGDSFSEIIDEFTIRASKKISSDHFKKILILVPSEWHTILGGFFIKPNPRRDVKVSKLAEILDEMAELGDTQDKARPEQAEPVRK